MQSAHDFLAGGGELGERIRLHDWAAKPLGLCVTGCDSLTARGIQGGRRGYSAIRICSWTGAWDWSSRRKSCGVVLSTPTQRRDRPLPSPVCVGQSDGSLGTGLHREPRTRGKAVPGDLPMCFRPAYDTEAGVSGCAPDRGFGRRQTQRTGPAVQYFSGKCGSPSTSRTESSSPSGGTGMRELCRARLSGLPLPASRKPPLNADRQQNLNS
jgi:hypothetical protein